MRRYHVLLILIVLLVAATLLLGYIPGRASMIYGPPAAALTIPERIEYSGRLLAHGSLLTAPGDISAPERVFHVDPGESVQTITLRLEEAGVIRSARAMYDYLVYTGLDRTLQSGDFTLNPGMSIIDIARELQDSTPQDVTFVILAGWRLEEVAASLPTSGLEITPDDFLLAARTPPSVLGDLPTGAGLEGFAFPDAYILPRSATVDQVLESIARNFNLHLTEDLRSGFEARGFGVYQAVTIASLVEREAVQVEEQGLIASVFMNRLAAGMQLGSDPTIQYALGYNPVQATWWTNPLSALDLQVDSPYNTYIHAGLPPGPIASPGLAALTAVASAPQSPYFYFRARCDESGYHSFAVTLEEHIANACP